MNKALKAVLVDIVEPEMDTEEAGKRLFELESLINTFGGIVVVKTMQKKQTPDYELFIGKGKVNEIFEIAREKKVEVLVLNNILKPKQIYNLKEAFKDLKIEVWDRIDLILKIFSAHAKSTEAKLQIELASIRHMGPRIYDMGRELMQQTGATGLRGGAGETNIEMMKRHLRKQEIAIQNKLKHYDTIRKGHRERRRRRNFKTAALVGYTNAGKSSLLNALTRKGAYVADKLFATLDTRVGKLYIRNKNHDDNGNYIPGKEVLISDTIGFIRDLPPELIQAFKSTLAETVESDLILHVIDINDPDIHKKIRVVEEILEQLELGGKPKIYVFNKIDLIDFKKERVLEKEKALVEAKRPPGLMKAGKDTARILGWHEEKKFKNLISLNRLKNRYRDFSPVFVSAEKKENLKNLIGEIERHI